MNFELFDHLYRSRRTILRILSDRGYNTKPYEKFGVDEIEAMATQGQEALRMDLERPAESTDSTITKCRVVYSLTKLKLRLSGFLFGLLEEGSDAINPKTTEVMVILAAPEGEAVVDTYHSAAYEQWSQHKLRVSFFRLASLVNHPADHILVPKHIRMNKTDIPFSPAEKVKLPLIRFHEDIQARIMGLIPGDVVKILRPSPSSGEYEEYRICSP
jgi:DNA-directed RNA polymerase subunit H (RpoH/RPB5)